MEEAGLPSQSQYLDIEAQDRWLQRPPRLQPRGGGAPGGLRARNHCPERGSALACHLDEGRLGGELLVNLNLLPGRGRPCPGGHPQPAAPLNCVCFPRGVSGRSGPFLGAPSLAHLWKLAAHLTPEVRACARASGSCRPVLFWREVARTRIVTAANFFPGKRM